MNEAISSVRIAHATRLSTKKSIITPCDAGADGFPAGTGIRLGRGLNCREDRERLGTGERRLGDLRRVVRPRRELVVQREEPAVVDDRTVEVGERRVLGCLVTSSRRIRAGAPSISPFSAPWKFAEAEQHAEDVAGRVGPRERKGPAHRLGLYDGEELLGRGGVLEVHRHTDRRPVRLDGLEVTLAALVDGEVELESVGVSGVGQQLLRRLGVVAYSS